MLLDEEETAMLNGERGKVLQMAMRHQVQVGDFFGARDFVRVTQAHVMADTESLGQAGVQWLERLSEAGDGRHTVCIRPSPTRAAPTSARPASWASATGWWNSSAARCRPSSAWG